MFEVGMRVVCVDAKPKKGAIGAIIPIHHLLREGAVYTIVRIFYSTTERNELTGEERLIMLTKGSTLDLAEITPPAPMQGFGCYRFRPIDPISLPEIEHEREMVPA